MIRWNKNATPIQCDVAEERLIDVADSIDALEKIAEPWFELYEMMLDYGTDDYRRPLELLVCLRDAALAVYKRSVDAISAGIAVISEGQHQEWMQVFDEAIRTMNAVSKNRVCGEELEPQMRERIERQARLVQAMNSEKESSGRVFPKIQ